QENTRVRHLEGGKKIVSKGDDFFDEDILKALTKEPQKGAKAMHNILSKMKVKTGDLFLLWRMRVLAGREELVLTGDPTKGWKEFDVRLPGGAPAAEATPVEEDPGLASE
ncbi:MAG: hypothetical protein EOO16_20390, partial [Chitinophagaceae bacterium]